MCGIFGSVSQEGLTARQVEDAFELLRHRGPDDQGHQRFAVDDGRQLDLIHRRLSIIDLSAQAAQPMSYDEGRLFLIYNGEIYNYRELRSELTGMGCVFVTQSDTEVVLAAYWTWGMDCVHHFNGDWAFCLYDRQERMLFLSRDRVGVKPLYYHRSGDRFFFASEIRPLLKVGGAADAYDPEALCANLLVGLSDYSERTVYRDIRQLEPATNARFELATGRFTVQKYWTPEVNGSNERPTAAGIITHSRRVRELLEDAVRLRLRSDVPVGSCLSGGLDSSAIVTITRRLLEQDRVMEDQSSFT